MFIPYELFVGLRYTRAKRRNHFISIISAISILGITLGVMALITVISVMNGFEGELRQRILGMASHATISGDDNRLGNWSSIAQQALVHPEVVAVAPYIHAEAMLTADQQVGGAVIRGVIPDQEREVSKVDQHMKEGSLAELKPGAFNILIGQELAQLLGVDLGDRVTLVTPQAQFTAIGALPRLKRFTVAGIFEVGMYEYDRGMAFIHIEDGAKLLRLGDDVSGIRLRLTDLFQAPRVVRELALEAGRPLWVSDWTRNHANFFRAVKLERTVMFVILALIVAVAAFNIVSTLVMVVTDKQADIAVLRTLGATPFSVMKLFMVQGTLIGLVGTLVGTAGGVALALNVETLVPALEQTFNVEFLDSSVYYLTELPSELRWADVGRIAGLSFALSIVATLYPAWRASRTQPAEALRYE